jgi:hypothetical protein
MMETIWSKDGYIEKENQEARNMIAAEEATCQEFPISCREREGVWGIWFGLGDKLILINPIELVNSIYMDDIYFLLDIYVKEGEKKPDGYYKVAINKWNSCFSWRIYHTHSQQMVQMQFTYEDYLGKIKECMGELYRIFLSDKPIAYKKFDVELESVMMCRRQLLVSGVTPSHYRLMTEDVVQEEFVFVPDQKHLEGYTIGIGDRIFHTWFTHWDSDMETVREQMESFIHQNAEIVLNFDSDETIIKIRHVSVLDEITKAGDGHVYKYKDFDLVEIIPNSFVKMPIIKGYCKEDEALRCLYEGLLDIAMRHPADGKESSYDDTPSTLVAYNRYKSPLIESYLRGHEHQPNTYKTRQVIVKDIIRIDPDYDAFLWDSERASIGLDELYDKNGHSIQMPELEAWAQEMTSIIVESETGHPYEKDWADYHSRGITLAHQLREQLSTDFDLWYEAPYEDKSRTILRRRLIY